MNAKIKLFNFEHLQFQTFVSGFNNLFTFLISHDIWDYFDFSIPRSVLRFRKSRIFIGAFTVSCRPSFRLKVQLFVPCNKSWIFVYKFPRLSSATFGKFRQMSHDFQSSCALALSNAATTTWHLGIQFQKKPDNSSAFDLDESSSCAVSSLRLCLALCNCYIQEIY